METADTIITFINKFQHKYGEEVIPSQKRLIMKYYIIKLIFFSLLCTISFWYNTCIYVHI